MTKKLYDSDGRMTGFIDDSGRHYDSDGRMTGFTDSSGRHYDSDARMTGFTDDSGRDYDSDARQTGFISDDGGEDDSDGRQTESSKSGCYIATATLKGGGSEAQLNMLRQWRNEVMRTTQLGRFLEEFYDKTGPTVVNRVRSNSILTATFLYPFVKPSVWLVQRRSESRVIRPIYDFLVYVVFLTGLAYGTILYLLFRK